jgi:3-oxoacyl-[acyl-carrier protein] reductase
VTHKSVIGKVALVTGASGGIGGSIALKLSAAGAKVAVHYNKSKQKAEQVLESILATGAEAKLFAGNVSDAEQVQAMFQDIEKEWSSVDILVNNAGITRDRLLLRMSEQDWDDVLAVNLKGAFLCCRSASRAMIRKRSGRIINISSVVALTGNLGQANYTASKAGLIGMTKSLARELASRNITVNAVAPGFIETDMVSALSEDARKQLTDRILMGSLGTPQDVAALVVFLAGEDARYITGQAINVDGGIGL